MSYSDRIRQAADPREAMQIIAEGLDEIVQALAAGSSSDSANGWGSWGGGAGNDASTAERSTVAPQPSPFTEDLEARDFYAAKQAAPNPAQVAAAQERVLRLEDMFARTPTPQVGALLDQAHAALSAAEKPGEYLDNSGGVIGTGEILRASEMPDGAVVVDLPPVDARRKAMRRELAAAIDLPGFFPPIMRSTPEAIEEIMHAYELGGPLWLYANRITPDEHDIFTQLPPAAKTVMVTDVMQDDQRQAWEFQRDIMKDEDAEGATLGIAQDNLNGVMGGAQTPLRGND